MGEPLAVTWKNFRGYQSPTTLEFPKLTLLIGRNNVGKTSAYAPLLLLKQTLDARDPQTNLLPVGELINAGKFHDFVHGHDTSLPIIFKLPIEPNGRRGAEDDGNSPRILELTFTDGGMSCELAKSRILDGYGKNIISRTRTANNSWRVDSPRLPKNSSPGRPSRDITELRSAIRNEQPRGFLFGGFPAAYIPSAWRKDESLWESARVWVDALFDLYDIQRHVNQSMYALLRKISYLGPLRSLPSSTYQISPEAPTAVGRDGQFSCELLLRSKNKAVLKEVNSWLERLGYGKLKFQEHRDEFFQVLIQPAESTFPVNIAHTGVGLSQLLPILVQGCLTEQDDTFIVQQPEIHLNPAQQCLIADFLIERTLRGTRTIIETHSEHLLLRLRRRIAEGQISANDVAIYYCDNENGNSTVDRVHIGQKAELERRDWPSGFFEEQLQDSIKLALAQARA